MSKVEPARQSEGRSEGPGAVHYRVEAPTPHTHRFHVTLRIAAPAEAQVVALPAWIPGSYLIREFSKNLQGLQARQGIRAVAVEQLDKQRWRLRCEAGEPLVLHYEVYAFDPSVRTAWLDAQRAFFNGTSMCLRVLGQEDAVHQIELIASSAMAGWSVATSAVAERIDSRGFGLYRAPDYDALVDAPFELGKFWSGAFTACGVPHRFVVAGATAAFDGARLLADTQKICEAQIRFWHADSAPAHDRYVFMLNAVDDGYGGLEHRESTALLCNRRDLPRLGEAKAGDGYTTLLGLISHEYFHTWNVKRLRPAELARYDYDRENYTQLLWFFEGLTSYYDDLLLHRAGGTDEATYLKLLTKTINQVRQTPGEAVQSVAQASFDAWVKYYRADENTPNATVSYYTKGALVGLCLDLTLRSEGHTTLDQVMRALWQHCGAGPMTEADLLEVLHARSGRSFAPEIAAWVHGTAPLPIEALLKAHGVGVLDEPSQMAQRLGLRVADAAGGSVQIKAVLRGGAAEGAGFAAGDEWLGLEVAGQGWRLARIDDVACYTGPHTEVTALIARDRRLHRLALTVPVDDTTWRLVALDAAPVRRWLGGSSAT